MEESSRKFMYQMVKEYAVSVNLNTKHSHRRVFGTCIFNNPERTKKYADRDCNCFDENILGLSLMASQASYLRFTNFHPFLAQVISIILTACSNQI